MDRIGRMRRLVFGVAAAVRRGCAGLLSTGRGVLAVAALALWTAGCASLVDDTAQQRQVASLLSFLYPDPTQIDKQPPGIAELRVPFRLGLVFVPDTAKESFRLSETERLRLLDRVRQSFRGYPFIQDIEVVPSHYLQPGGGFDNLRQVAQLLRLDVVALVSYDQVQNTGQSGWSFLYWTGVGAYTIEGDRYDILTVVEAAVVDVPSRRLLMRAMGSSTAKGSATLVGFEEKSRAARGAGFEQAIGQLIPQLDDELKRFRDRAASDPHVKLILPPGYDPRRTAAPAAR